MVTVRARARRSGVHVARVQRELPRVGNAGQSVLLARTAAGIFNFGMEKEAK